MATETNPIQSGSPPPQPATQDPAPPKPAEPANPRPVDSFEPPTPAPAPGRPKPANGVAIRENGVLSVNFMTMATSILSARTLARSIDPADERHIPGGAIYLNDLARDLDALGGTDAEVAVSLRAKAPNALKTTLDTILEIKRVISIVYAGRSIQAVGADDPRISELLEPAVEYVDDWIRKNATGLNPAITRDGLLKVLRTYVTVWLASTSETVDPKFSLIPVVLGAAINFESKDIDPINHADFEKAAWEVIASFKRGTDKRQQARMSGRAGVASSPHAPVSSAISPISLADLKRILGDELYDLYQKFCNTLVNGTSKHTQDMTREDRLRASHLFSQFFINYVHILSSRNTPISRESFKNNGIDIPTAQTVIASARNRDQFTDNILNIVRSFFRGVLGSPESKVPPPYALRPPLVAGPGLMGLRVPYDPRVDGGIKSGLLTSMRRAGIPTGPELDSFLAQRIGSPRLSLFSNWGEYQPKPNSISQNAWRRLVSTTSESARTIWDNLVMTAALNNQLEELLKFFRPNGTLQDIWLGQIQQASAAGADALLEFATERLPADLAPKINLRTLLLSHTPTDDGFKDLLEVGKKSPEAVWKEMVDGAKSRDDLVRLALDHPPLKGFSIDDQNWRLVIAAAIANAESEDVVTEPRTEKAYDLIVPVYMALSEWAWMHGYTLDPLDLAAAAFLPIRRILAEAIEKTENETPAAREIPIEIAIPPFMDSVAIQNWGITTFARKYKESGFSHGLSEATFDHHRYGDVMRVLYWDLRNYLEVARVSGQTDTQRKRFYDFACFLQLMFVLNSIFPHVYDDTGARKSPCPLGIPSRYRIALAASDAVFVEGTHKPATTVGKIEPDILIDVANGNFTETLNLIEAYLEGIKSFPYPAKIEDSPDGASMDTLLEKTRLLISNHRVNLANMHGGFLASVDDKEGSRNFYRDVRRFAENVLVNMRVSGEAHFNGATTGIPFIIAPNVEGVTRQPTPDGTSIVIVDDVATQAHRRDWSLETQRDIMKARILIGQAVHEGKLTNPSLAKAGVICDAIRERWDGSEDELERAVYNFIELEGSLSKPRVATRTALVTRFSKPTHNRILFPVLPPKSPSWSTQFETFAKQRGLSDDNIAKAIAALRVYYTKVRFYSKFDGDVLKAELSHTLPAAVVNTAYTAIDDFFPTIAVANSGSQPRPYPATTLEDANNIATQVVFAYAMLFPNHNYAINIDNITLLDIIHTLADSSGSLPKHITNKMVLDAASRILAEHNSHVAPAATADIRAPGMFEVGLGRKRLDSHIISWKQAHPGVTVNEQRIIQTYFKIANYIAAGMPLEDDDITPYMEDIPGPGPLRNDISCLKQFIQGQRELLETWENLITHPSYGIAGFTDLHISKIPFKSHGSQPRLFTKDSLVLTAMAFGAARITLAQPSSTALYAYEIIGARFLPHIRLAERVSAAASDVFVRWREEAHRTISEKVERALKKIEGLRNQESYVVESEDIFLTDVAKSAGLSSSRELAGLFRQHVLMCELISRPQKTSPLIIARLAYESTIKPRSDRIFAERQKIRGQIEEHLEKVTALNGRVQTESAAQLYDIDIKTLTKPQALAWQIRLQTGKNLLLGLTSEIDVLQEVPATIGVLAKQLLALGDPNHTGSQAKARNQIQEARDAITTSTSYIENQEKAIEARLRRIERLEEIARLKQQSEQRAEKLRNAATQARTAIGKARAATAEVGPLISRPIPATPKGGLSLAQFNESRETLKLEGTHFDRMDMKLRSAYDAIAAKLRVLEQLSSDVSQLERDIRTLAKFTDPSFAAAVEGYYASVREARAAQDEIGGKRSLILRRAGELKSKVEDLENRIVVAPLSPLPPLETIELVAIDITDGNFVFTQATPYEDYRRSSQRKLASVLSFKILSRGNESHLISEKDAQRIRDWKRDSRKIQLELEDIFGRKIVLGAGEFGVRVAFPRDIEASHLARKITEFFAGLGSTNSMELKLLTLITPEDLRTQTPVRDLFIGLLGTVATATTHSRPHEIVSTWALRNRPQISRVVGDEATSFFLDSVLAERPPEHIYGPEYNAGEHLRHATRIDLLIEGATSPLRPIELAQAKLLRRIFSNPDLMALGWLHTKREAQEMLGRVMLPLALNLQAHPDLPDGEISRELVILQDAAVNLWLNSVSGLENYPELDTFSEKTIMGFLTESFRLPEKGKNTLVEAMRKRPALRRVLAATLCLDTQGVAEPAKFPQHDTSALYSTFPIDEPEQDKIDGWLSKNARLIAQRYGRVRQKYLAIDKRKAQHAQGKAVSFIQPDQGLTKDFPELGMLSPAILLRFWNGIHSDSLTSSAGSPRHAVKMTTFIWIVDIAPQMIPIAAMLSHPEILKRMPFHGDDIDILDQMTDLIRECDSDVLTMGKNRPRLVELTIKLYRQLRSTKIIPALKDSVGNMTLAERLTGLTNPEDPDALQAAKALVSPTTDSATAIGSIIVPSDSDEAVAEQACAAGILPGCEANLAGTGAEDLESEAAGSSVGGNPIPAVTPSIRTPPLIP